MEIRIKGTENGWATDRRMVLPDDKKLTDAILRTVRRYQQNLKKAAEQEETPADAEAVTDDEPVIKETEGGEPPAAAEEPKVEEPVKEKKGPKGISGFVFAQCEDCKDTWAFCTRYRIKHVDCKKCGHRTELRDIAPATLQCAACGKKWEYQTNCTDADLGGKCLECGHEMRAWWEPKKMAYIPQF